MKGCPFCDRIAAGEYDTTEEMVYDFEPLNPVVPGHRLFVPYEHVGTAADMPGVTGRVFKVAARWGASQQPAFNLITSAGAAATQTVPHLHIHYVPRYADDGLRLPWTPAAPVDGAE
jgi:histidine triad (HIT) family protein